MRAYHLSNILCLERRFGLRSKRHDNRRDKPIVRDVADDQRSVADASDMPDSS
jgi:hypothetical protein